MKGSIYTDQKCLICGRRLLYFEGRGLMQCPDHHDVIWRSNCLVRFGRGHSKRFKTVNEAERHLNYLRVQTDNGSYDPRGWQKNQPLAFGNLRRQYIQIKRKESLSKKHVDRLEFILNRAGKTWDTMSIKDIAEGEIEDFINADHGVGQKTLSNWKGALTGFWKWVVRREKRKSGLEMPEFPHIRFELGWRNIVDVETQQAIINEIRRLTWDINPRIYLGIKLLSLYPKIPPGEMRNVQEGHINLKERWIVFPQPKEKKPKFIHLLPEHCELISSVWEPRGLPHMYFFRHVLSRSGVIKDEQFGQKLFYYWWRKACRNLKIEGVDLYGGTKHSTVTALGTKLTPEPEQIQRGATGHASDAFKRYMLPDKNEAIIATMEIEQMQSEKNIVTFPKGKTGND